MIMPLVFICGALLAATPNISNVVDTLDQTLLCHLEAHEILSPGVDDLLTRPCSQKPAAATVLSEDSTVSTVSTLFCSCSCQFAHDSTVGHIGCSVIDADNVRYTDNA